MDYDKVLEIERKIKDLECEVTSLKNIVEIEKTNLRRQYDPCPTCGRSDKQGVITPFNITPSTWNITNQNQNVSDVSGFSPWNVLS